MYTAKKNKGSFKREIVSYLIAAQNNTIKTNNVEAKVDKTQQNSKCRLYGDRANTIDHILSKCSKLVQTKYKTRHNWLGKVTHWELCKKLKLNHTN